MSFKKSRVVMLPTNKKAENGNIILNTPNNQLYIMKNREKHSNYDTIHVEGSSFYEWDKAMIPHHLYFITDDGIKEGDWQYTITHGITKVKNLLWSEQECAKKVIATTDLEIAIKKGEYNIGELSRKIMIPTETTILPQPSKLFIQKYLDMYNKKTAIESCMIEYEQPFPGNPSIFDKLKINSNNEITIKRIKDSWNRKEVIDLFSKYQYDYAQWVLKMEYDLENKPTPVEWINKNL